jgi:hypothetical protein
MEQLPGSTSTADKIMKFWDTKAGTVAMAVYAVIGSVALFALYKVLPYLITLFTNAAAAFGFAIVASVLAVILAFIVYVLSLKETRLAFTYLAVNIARKINKAVVDTDPIGSAKTALERMRKKLEQIRKHQRNVAANYKRLDQLITENNEERTQELNLAKTAQEQGKRAQAEIHASAALELENSNKSLMPLYKQMAYFNKVLTRVGDTSDAKIAMFERKIQIKEKELAVKRAGQEATRAARGIFSGDDQTMLDESLDSIGSQIASAEAEMEEFMNSAAPILEAEDLRRGMQNEQAMGALNAWLTNQTGSSTMLLESGEARTLLLESGTPEPAIFERPKTGSFAGFFDSNNEK